MASPFGCLTVLGAATNGQHIPRGKPWDRQPNSGKLRRKLVSVPGLRRISGQLAPKRLNILAARRDEPGGNRRNPIVFPGFLGNQFTLAWTMSKPLLHRALKLRSPPRVCMGRV